MSPRWLLSLLVLTAIGCSADRSSILGLSRPQWFHPGSLDYQRNTASLHDPFPDNDVAPEVVGGRPREFQKPLAEPVRNRSQADSWWSRR
jgi:hypothetical protein